MDAITPGFACPKPACGAVRHVADRIVRRTMGARVWLPVEDWDKVWAEAWRMHLDTWQPGLSKSQWQKAAERLWDAENPEYAG